MTNEQLADAVARIAELDAKRAAGNWYAHNDNQAINACVVNCHKEGWDRVESDYTLVDADECPNLEPDDIAFIAAAPLMARIIRQLSAEREAATIKTDNTQALYNALETIKQQREEIDRLRSIKVTLEAVMESEAIRKQRAAMVQAREALGSCQTTYDMSGYVPEHYYDDELVDAALAALDAALGSRKCERSQSELPKQTDGLGRV